MLGAADFTDKAGHDRDTGRQRQFLGFDLVAHRRDRLRRRADERDIVIGKQAREAFTLRQEAITGVDRLGTSLLARQQDRFGEQIGFGCGRRSQPHSLVR